ncbi:glycosyl hydrolase family 28-related protein [Candidatus Pantoea multigeneris]|uniref:Amylovoran biosynthesis protein AmsF n=1 Tax=Candidatus Pantoea multigeneris TaxID=2608357 RepID=A0ABX0RGR7_9GAMM|nr:glycosyl hydrolase family 28-related protein [Pantoea multigeneris]NIF23486.1 amylovoran biosynthesis protein AmsF [Pantoea multigeneris]
MIEVNSFAELRTTTPSASGVVAKLNRYYDKDSTFRGGGTFVGFIGTTTSTDDGGTLAVGSGFYWKRTINDPTEVNILHFGAKGDGTTDDTDAFKRMLTWTQGWNASCKDLPVRFPGGKFLIKPIDISGTEVAFFGLIGDDLELGSLPRTTIISDKTSSTVFKVKARRTHIKGIAWNGQCTADTTTNTGTITAEMCSNVQPFFENTTVGGETVNIDCFRASYTGGTVIKLLDTLDSKFNQIYTLYTYSRIFDIGWSNTVAGNWDHSTAVELCNANFQTGYGDYTLYMPRVTQGIIRNVWIEHTINPGTLADGGWTIDTLNIEDCDNAFDLTNARVIMRQIGLQAGATINTSLASGKWLSTFEYGYRREENHGTIITGSLFAGYYSGYKITNNTTTDNWYRVGQFFFPNPNQQWVMEMISKADATTTPSTTAGSPVNMTGTGKTWINLQRLDTVWADACHMGSPAVQDIRYSRVGTTYAVVWVKLAANSGDTMFTLRNTGPTRFDAGSCSLFQPDFSVVSDTTKLGSLKPAARFGMHNGLAGIGANEKGVLTLASAVGTPTDKTTPTGFVLVNINGVDHKVPYYD